LEMLISEGTQHDGGGWGGGIVGTTVCQSKGKMLFILPGVLQKATWKVQ